MYDYCIFEINAISRAILVNEVDMQLMISHSTTNFALKEIKRITHWIVEMQSNNSYNP